MINWEISEFLIHSVSAVSFLNKVKIMPKFVEEGSWNVFIVRV